MVIVQTIDTNIYIYCYYVCCLPKLEALVLVGFLAKQYLAVLAAHVKKIT